MSAILVWVVRVLVVLVVLRVLFRALAGRRTMGTRARQRIGGSLVRDPHCGTYLPPGRALTLTTSTGVLHFCSDRCRDAWAASHG